MLSRTSLFATCITVAMALGSAASAATLTGTFTIGIYNFNAGGSIPGTDASTANVAAHSGDYKGTTTYTGALDFSTFGEAKPTIYEFLNSGGGAYSLASSIGNLIMSGGGFQETTLFDIYGKFASAVNGTVSHDDGSSLYNGVSYAHTIFDSAAPTSEKLTSFFANAGAFRLIYSAANGNPEVLTANTSPVPVPAGSGLLMLAIAGLGLVKRRKTNA